mgnify:CR=1 FL=1
MARSREEKRAKRKARRAKQEQLRAKAGKPTSAPSPDEVLDALSPDELDAMMRALTDRMHAEMGGGPTIFDQAPEVELDFSGGPPFACRANYTPGAVQLVLGGGAVPGKAPPPPFILAKLRALYGVARPYDLRWAHDATTPQLLGALSLVGVAFDEARFRALAAERQSAWDLAEQLVSHSHSHDEIDGVSATDVAGCCLVVLWGRWAPELPCVERLCDAVQRGYHAADRENADEAMAHWTEAWHLAEALAWPPDRLEGRLLEPLSGWLFDARLVRWNHLLDHPDRPDVAADYLAYVQWVRSVRPDHESLADEAEALAAVGRREEGIAMLQQAIADHPDDAGLYARLSDLYDLGVLGNERRAAEALAVLQQAVARGIDGKSWDLDLRIADLQRDLV